MSKTLKPASRATMELRSKEKLRSVAPASSETIERWGSIIHWPELAVVWSAGKFRGYFRWIVPITCGSCKKRRPANVYNTNPVSGSRRRGSDS